MAPQIGDSVWYFDGSIGPDGALLPTAAIITGLVESSETLEANLILFPAASSPSLPDNATVPFSAEPAVGCWTSAT